MHKMVNGEQVELTPDEVAEFNAREAAWVAETAAREAKAQILDLEKSITPRRLREAVLSQEGKTWLENIETQIAALRVAAGG